MVIEARVGRRRVHLLLVFYAVRDQPPERLGDAGQAGGMSGCEGGHRRAIYPQEAMMGGKSRSAWLVFLLISTCIAGQPYAGQSEHQVHAERPGRRVHRSDDHVSEGRPSRRRQLATQEKDIYVRNGVELGRDGIPVGAVWTGRNSFYDAYGNYRLAENYTVPPAGKQQGVAKSIKYGELLPEPPSLNEDMPANFWFGEQVAGGRYSHSVQGKPWMRQARPPPPP